MTREFNRETWQRIFELFSEASEQPPAERARLLEALRGEDPEMATEVAAMLGAKEPEEELEIERRLFDAASASDAGTSQGTRLGAYRLLRLLGRGGMGEVHLAERIDGGFEQLVAVKILRAGLLSTDAIDRFHRERAIQARLVHPAVVPLLDGGVAPDGRPYLVLQFVDGRPITRYSDDHKLSIEQRLHLVVAVGRAIEFAHSQLVVHRDIKPSNILISEQGDVHLLDFGIARMLGDHGGDASLTRDSLAPMTPSRAAPEQLRGEAPSTATDVWGLGVLLFELLTGRLPFDTEGRAPAEIEHHITSHEPTRLSEAVTLGDVDSAGSPASVAAARGTTPERLVRELRGDLELIVAKALHVAPDRRYRSAAAMVGDLEAFLEGRPVAARPDSAAYRARRFVGRHRAASAAVAITILSLVLFAVSTRIQSARVARERDRATANERTANAVNDLLVGLFGGTDPRTGAGVTMVSIPELLKKADQRVAAMSDQPALQARLWHRLGAIHFERSEGKRAFELYERALAASRDVPIADEARAELLLDHARALEEIGRTKESVAEVRELLAALEASAATPPALLARTLQELGERVGGDEGLPLVERSLAMRRRAVPVQPMDVAASLHSLAVIEWRRQNRTRARETWREALAIMERQKGFDNPETRAVMGGLALVLEDPREEEAIHRRILLSIERQLGPEAKALAFTWNNLGVCLARQKRYDEADGALREAHRRWLATLGPAHHQTQRNLGSIARNLDLAGRSEASLPLYREVRRRRAAGGPQAPPMIPVTVSEAEVLIRLGQLDEAERRLKEVQKDLAAGPAGSLDTASSDVALGRLRMARGNAVAAAEAFRRAVALRQRLMPAVSESLAEARCELGRALVANGDAEGRKLLTTSLPRFKAWRSAHPADIARLQESLDTPLKDPGSR